MGNFELISIIAAIFFLVVYAIHLLMFTWGWFRIGRNINDKGYQPKTKVSIIIAARNEAEKIPLLLQDVKAQDYPGDLMEVIVVDDHSTDRTPLLVERIIRQGAHENIRLLSLEQLGKEGSKKKALEAGIAVSSGDLIAVTDADCQVGDKWIRSLASIYEMSGGMVISGPVIPVVKEGWFGSFQEMEFLSLIGAGAGAIGAGSAIFCNGANMAFSREAFQEVGGYRDNYGYSSGDDVFLLHKIKKRFGSGSIRFIKDRDSQVSTIGTAGFKEFIMQRVRWASKASGYKDFLSITTALSVFFINLVLLLLIISGIFHPFHFILFGLMFILKLSLDFPLMWGITSFFDKRRLMFWFVPFELMYVFYVLLAGLTSLFYSGRWKDRPVQR